MAFTNLKLISVVEYIFDFFNHYACGSRKSPFLIVFSVTKYVVHIRVKFSFDGIHRNLKIARCIGYISGNMFSAAKNVSMVVVFHRTLIKLQISL